MGDFLLVKPLETHITDLLWLPNTVKRGAQQLRRGRVIAAGPGDKLVTVRCTECGTEREFVALLEWLHSDHLRGPVRTKHCRLCGCRQFDLVDTDKRVPMEVQPGDEILYWRAPANDVRIAGAEYVFLREGQHVVGVIEAKESNAEEVLA